MVAQLTNNLVSARQPYAEIHPKLCSDGKFRGQPPPIFFLPQRLDVIASLDSTYFCFPPLVDFLSSTALTRISQTDTSLDRILSAYNLPFTSNSSFLFNFSTNNLDNRAIKLLILLEFLGVNLEDINVTTSAANNFSGSLSVFGANGISGLSGLSGSSNLTNNILTLRSALSGGNGLNGLNGVNGLGNWSRSSGMGGSNGSVGRLGSSRQKLGEPGQGRPRGMSDD
jgi:hypothetical protein